MQCAAPCTSFRRVRPACLLALAVALAVALAAPVLAHQQTQSKTARLTRSLLDAASPKVGELRERLNRVSVAKVNDRFMRGEQGVVKGVESASVMPERGKPGVYRGVVRVAVVWMSPDQRLFDYRDEAQDAELVEAEPGRLKLFYLYRKGDWTFQRITRAHAL